MAKRNNEKWPLELPKELKGNGWKAYLNTWHMELFLHNQDFAIVKKFGWWEKYGEIDIQDMGYDNHFPSFKPEELLQAINWIKDAKVNKPEHYIVQHGNRDKPFKCACGFTHNGYGAEANKIMEEHLGLNHQDEEDDD